MYIIIRVGETYMHTRGAVPVAVDKGGVTEMMQYACQSFKKCLKIHLFRLAHWGVDYDSNNDNVQRLNNSLKIKSLLKYLKESCLLCPE